MSRCDGTVVLPKRQHVTIGGNETVLGGLWWILTNGDVTECRRSPRNPAKVSEAARVTLGSPLLIDAFEQR